MQSQESMLYLVGLGLGDAKDITVKGLEIVKRADYVFLEAYTSILCVGQEVLVCKVHKNALWLTWTWPKVQSKLIPANSHALGVSLTPGNGYQWFIQRDFVYLPTLRNSMMCHLAPQSLTSCLMVLNLCHINHCQWSWPGATQKLFIFSPFRVHKMYFSEKQSSLYRSSS